MNVLHTGFGDELGGRGVLSVARLGSHGRLGRNEDRVLVVGVAVAAVGRRARGTAAAAACRGGAGCARGMCHRSVVRLVVLGCARRTVRLLVRSDQFPHR